MAAIAFDTHKYVKRLVAAGMPEAQAEAIADEQRSLIEGQLATKRDLKELEDRLGQRFDGKLIEMEQRLTLRLGGMIVAGIAAVTALVRIL